MCVENQLRESRAKSENLIFVPGNICTYGEMGSWLVKELSRPQKMGNQTLRLLAYNCRIKTINIATIDLYFI
jgi:hypothetical protein